uniref:Uncharacterized protein n=1 Tax=Magallana gigas TaxID=29159 RepID=A0A8W8MD40_MAGGI
MSELRSDRRENNGADQRIESGSVDTPRARARSVMTTKLYGGRPSSAFSNRVTSARKKKELQVHNLYRHLGTVNPGLLINFKPVGHHYTKNGH